MAIICHNIQPHGYYTLRNTRQKVKLRSQFFDFHSCLPPTRHIAARKPIAIRIRDFGAIETGKFETAK
jgi:hypothetical protein